MTVMQISLFNDYVKKENDQLHQLVNKYHESKNASRKLDDVKTKKVNIIMNSVHYMYKSSK